MSALGTLDVDRAARDIILSIEFENETWATAMHAEIRAMTIKALKPKIEEVTQRQFDAFRDPSCYMQLQLYPQCGGYSLSRDLFGFDLLNVFGGVGSSSCPCCGRWQQ